ncbi:DUF3307 domain-containing protein [Parabacteroides sp. OttesenSCG-928-G06]|nr:DUF3307 domain-containing protein [Parabacteroides sp. OttesenSCG-928-G06]
MIINYLILVKLLLAHFLVDFCFQSKIFVQKKREGKQSYHLVHAVTHASFAYFFVGCLKAWYIPLVVFGSHYLIDLWKSKRKESLTNFIIDQMMHLAIIIMLWLFVADQTETVRENIIKLFENKHFWVYLTGFVFVLKPTSVILSVSTKKWEAGRSFKGLENAGQWIGYLERILILIFISLSVYEAIGFLLAAKSIYRFGELKEPSEVKKTEYIMIGTFLSFTIAIIVGLILNSLV